MELLKRISPAAHCSLRNVKLAFKTRFNFYSRVNTVMIENSTLCNANCKMCPRSSISRKKETMSMDLFKTIIRRCRDEGVEWFGFGGFGEPLIDPDIQDKVRYAVDLGVKGDAITTNASLLNDSLMDLLVNNFKQIGISLDGLSDEIYEKVDRGLKKEAVYKNVERFLQRRNAYQGERPRVFINYVVFEDNYHEKEAFLNYWKKRLSKGDTIAFLYAHNWGNSVLIKPAPGIITSKYRIACGRLWGSTVIVSVDGKYALCCMDHNRQIDLGNIRALSINDYWRGKGNLNRIRLWHLLGKFENIPLCHYCSYNYLIKQDYEMCDIA